MTRLFIYLFLFGTILFFLSLWGRKQTEPAASKQSQGRSNRWFRAKIHPREVWVQVYETSSMEEARLLQARLEEEEIECVVYEQGKRDIHGNEMPGVGIVVPRTSVAHSQQIISRLPT